MKNVDVNKNLTEIARELINTDSSKLVNLEVEYAILGGLLIKGSGPLYGLRDDFFYDQINQEIFRIIASLKNNQSKFTPITVKPYFEKYLKDNNGDAQEYLLKLLPHACSGVHLKDYVNILKDLWIRRSLIEKFDDSKSALDNMEPTSSILEFVQDFISEAKAYNSTTRKTDFTAEQATREFDNFMHDDHHDYISTGLVSIDKVCGGLSRKTFVLLAGRPSMGKTMIATSIALSQAKKDVGVLYLSLEMSVIEIMARMACDKTYNQTDAIHYKNILDKTIANYHFDRVTKSAREIKNMPLIISDSTRLSTQDIREKIIFAKNVLEEQDKRLEVVYVDHIGHIKASSRYSGQRNNEMTEISSELLSIAKEFDVCLVGVSQLNRGVESRESKLPGLSDLRDSGSLEQDANMILLAYRPVYYEERKEDMDFDLIEQLRNSLKINIAKNRNGGTGIVNLSCCPPANAVRDQIN